MNPWNRFHNEFKVLMEEEDTIVRERGLRGWFHGSVIYEESREFGSWSFASITTESLQARFDVVAAEAGIALGSPPGAMPGAYWLDRLFADLRANKSQHIRIFNEAGGFIERLFEASAMFCARLNRQSLEDAVMSPEGPRVEGEPANEGGETITGEAGDTAVVVPTPMPAADRTEPGNPSRLRRGPKRDYETARRVEEIVTRVAGGDKWRSKLDDICYELDEASVRRPKTWKARGYTDWVDAMRERHLVEKAISHHLKLGRILTSRTHICDSLAGWIKPTRQKTDSISIGGRCSLQYGSLCSLHGPFFRTPTLLSKRFSSPFFFSSQPKSGGSSGGFRA